MGEEKDHGLSAAQIEKQLNRSLERLGVDEIDLYQCHRFDKETPLEETMRALDRAVQAGKVRAIGFSEWTAEQIDAAARIADSGGLTAFSSSQPQYSMLVAEAGAVSLCGLRAARDWEPGVFSAGAWGADWKVCAGATASAGKPRGKRWDESVYGDGGTALPVGFSAEGG